MTLKTDKVLKAYNIISQAKYTKLDDADKIKVWKIARALKPVATKYDEDTKDAAEKLKPEGFDESLRKAQEYERIAKDKDANASGLEMGAAEYGKFIGELQKYNRLVNDAVREFADKEVELTFDALSEEAFTKLMNSNDWTMAQALAVGEIIVGNSE